MADAIRLRSVVALSGRFPVLAGADLTVTDGQVVLLRGANGAGKTSLLRVCAGLLAVTSGEAVVLGHDLTAGAAERRALRRSIGLLGHETFLYDDLSVRENVRFAVRAAGLGAGAADDALGQLGLDGRLADLAAGRLSAGQRRRAALAVLVARRPRLWLLDEPHAGLDTDGRAVIDGVVTAAVAQGAAVVIASHERGPADDLAAMTVEVGGGRTRERPASSSGPADGPSAASSAASSGRRRVEREHELVG